MSAFSAIYDSVNESAYKKYADYLQSCFSKSLIPVKEVLDLGCGTGGITAIMADRGFDMVGVDISPDMLSEAYSNNAGKNTLLLCQDMREFELYGTVQAVYSSFDCVNYLTQDGDLKKLFDCVHNYLEPGGVFAFDINTLFRYETVFDGKSYVYEDGDCFLVWQSAFDKKTGICSFLLDSFDRESSGLYCRTRETQLQRCFSHSELVSCADGLFEILETGGGKGFDGCSEEEKCYYLMRRI